MAGFSFLCMTAFVFVIVTLPMRLASLNVFETENAEFPIAQELFPHILRRKACDWIIIVSTPLLKN